MGYSYMNLSFVAQKIIGYHVSLIGITGSSGAGKTTLSLDLQQKLQYLCPEKKITVIQTDNFIYPNAYLDKHHLMNRKGFPESFDFVSLKNCLQAVREYENTSLPISTPCYSQDIKDIIPGKKMVVEKSDLYIFEGVNLFFAYENFHASDYLEFSIYLDTDRSCIKERALKRFWAAYEKSTITPTPYFEKFFGWSDEAILAYAEELWKEMDMNLLENYIEPHKSLASLVLKSYTI